MDSPSPIETEFVFGHRYPKRSLIYRAIAERSVEARRAFPGNRDIAYGPHSRQRMNLFLAGTGAPLVVFFHGGYWRSQDRQNYDFVAHAFCARGFSLVVPGYPLAPETSMADILGSVHALLIWLDRHAVDHGLSLEKVYASGHSAGGHLAAMLAVLATSDLGLPRVRGCLPISGLFDLRPLLRTSINADLRMDAATAERFSPQLRPVGPSWLVAACGTCETASFQKQTADYVLHWARGGSPANILPIPDKNHYNILLDLASAESRIAAELQKRVVAEG